jgi:hypothetical protein
MLQFILSLKNPSIHTQIAGRTTQVRGEITQGSDIKHFPVASDEETTSFPPSTYLIHHTQVPPHLTIIIDQFSFPTPVCKKGVPLGIQRILKV